MFVTASVVLCAVPCLVTLWGLSWVHKHLGVASTVGPLVLPKYFSSGFRHVVKNHYSSRYMCKRKARIFSMSWFIFHFSSQCCFHCLTVLLFMFFFMAKELLLISLLGKVKLWLAFSHSHFLQFSVWIYPFFLFLLSSRLEFYSVRTWEF